MIKRISVDGYKSLQSLSVELRPLTVLFGPNGVGKSNFLDVLLLLSRIVQAPRLQDAFAPPYRGNPLQSFAYGPGGVEELLDQDSASFSIEADVELSEATVEATEALIRQMRSAPGEALASSRDTLVRERSLRYRIQVEIVPAASLLRVTDEALTALGPDGPKSHRSRRPFVERVDRKLRVRMERQARPREFDLYLDRSVLSEAYYAPHCPHITAFKRELANWRFYYFEPRERMRASRPVREVHNLGPMGEELGSFLNTLKEVDPAQFEALQRALRILVPEVSGVSVGVDKFGEVDLRIVEGRTEIPAMTMSEGTLRILGLLALGATREPPTLIGFEEPENGVHARRVAQIGHLLTTRVEDGATQVIATTHSGTLLDALPAECLYACARGANGTQIRPALGGLFGELEAAQATEDLGSELPLPMSERILRGDFDA